MNQSPETGQVPQRSREIISLSEQINAHLGLTMTSVPTARLFGVAHVGWFYDAFAPEILDAMKWAKTIALENTPDKTWSTNEFYFQVGEEAIKQGKRISNQDPASHLGETIDRYVVPAIAGASVVNAAIQMRRGASRRQFIASLAVAGASLLALGETFEGRSVQRKIGVDIDASVGKCIPSYEDYRNVAMALELLRPENGNTVLYVGARHVESIKDYVDSPATLATKRAIYRV